SGLSRENRLQRFALLRIGPFIDEETHPGLDVLHPYVSLESGKREEVEAVKPNRAIMTLANVPRQHALAGIVGRGLSKLARSRNIALQMSNQSPTRRHSG